MEIEDDTEREKAGGELLFKLGVLGLGLRECE